MPLFAMLAFNFILGAMASLAAARELRASPRAVRQTRAFRAVLWQQALVAVPIATFALARYTDWMFSYLADAAHVPSVLLAGFVALEASLAVLGFALGARFLRDHRARWTGWMIGAGLAVVVISALAVRDRVGTLASYAQYRGAFGLRSFWRSSAFGTLASLGAGWLASGAHLMWALARRL